MLQFVYTACLQLLILKGSVELSSTAFCWVVSRIMQGVLNRTLFTGIFWTVTYSLVVDVYIQYTDFRKVYSFKIVGA